MNKRNKRNIRYNVNSIESKISTPLLENNHKKLPKPQPKTYDSNSYSTHSNCVLKLWICFCQLIKRICPCCFEYQVDHICYFTEEKTDLKFEDKIKIEHNYMVHRDYLPLIFWGELNHEEVFFNEEEQEIIEEMKEKIKKYE